jgi:hypothetical protein
MIFSTESPFASVLNNLHIVQVFGSLSAKLTLLHRDPPTLPGIVGDRHIERSSIGV